METETLECKASWTVNRYTKDISNLCTIKNIDVIICNKIPSVFAQSAKHPPPRNRIANVSAVLHVNIIGRNCHKDYIALIFSSAIIQETVMTHCILFHLRKQNTNTPGFAKKSLP